jgi:hypothetical protein
MVTDIQKARISLFLKEMESSGVAGFAPENVKLISTSPYTNANDGNETNTHSIDKIEPDDDIEYS